MPATIPQWSFAQMPPPFGSNSGAPPVGLLCGYRLSGAYSSVETRRSDRRLHRRHRRSHQRGRRRVGNAGACCRRKSLPGSSAGQNCPGGVFRIGQIFRRAPKRRRNRARSPRQLTAPKKFYCGPYLGSFCIRSASSSVRIFMPSTANNSIVAVFRSNADAQAAATDLQAAGIPRSDIYVETSSSGQTTSQSKSTMHEGGIKGWFKSIFGDEDDADRDQYERAISEGNTLLVVDADDDEISTVEEILNRHSPVEVSQGEERTQVGAATREGRTQANNTQGRSVPVVQEDMQVGKRRVLRGNVRVYSRVVSQPVEETVRLREEHVRVERQPVNRPATEADLAAGQEKVIEVQEFAEEPVIGKQARVVEEVRVGKDVTERTETVRDTLRHTEVNVEQTPGKTGASPAFDDSDFRTDFQNRYAASGATYDTYLPAYRYGYEMASDPRYQGRSFDGVESDLRTDYGRRYPNSTWEKMKDAIRYGWNRVTGKTKAAANR